MRQAAAFADGQAIRLQRLWEPLAKHLNASAAALLDLDRTAAPTLDPAVRTLRLRARIHFLERFRSALWLSQVVWAHMASKPIRSIHEL